MAVKDEYTFDFLELADEHSERQLEQAILAKVEPFLLEMGGMFSFIGSQYRLEVSDKEYFIDLLLFHRRLRALVAVELKIGEFQPEHIGKMQFYLAVLDDTARMEGENPAIGILICKSKNRTIVEYALKESSKPIGVATYRIVRRFRTNSATTSQRPSRLPNCWAISREIFQVCLGWSGAVAQQLPINNWQDVHWSSMQKGVSAATAKERPYKTTGLHLPEELWVLLNRVAFERARRNGGRASVSALLVEMIEKNRKALELELGKTVR